MASKSTSQTDQLPSRIDSLTIDPNNGDLVAKYKLDNKTTVSKIIDSSFNRLGSGGEAIPGTFLMHDVYTKGAEDTVHVCTLRPKTNFCSIFKIRALVNNMTDMKSCRLISEKYYLKVIDTQVTFQRIGSKVLFCDGVFNAGFTVSVKNDTILFSVIGMEGLLLKWDIEMKQVHNNFVFDPKSPEQTTDQTTEQTTEQAAGQISQQLTDTLLESITEENVKPKKIPSKNKKKHNDQDSSNGPIVECMSE